MDFITHKFNTSLMDSIAMTSNQSSEPKDISGISLYSVQHIWSGASGTLSVVIEATNVLNNPQDSDYTALDTYSIVTAAGSRMFTDGVAGYSKVRVRLAQTTGAGTLKSIINGKVI